MASEDIKKVRETRTKDDGDWEQWPYPTLEIESVISGDLRSRILAKLDIADDGSELRLIETNASAGYTEFTQEDECSIEVRAGSVVLWSDEYNSSLDSSMAAFLKEFG